MVRAACSLCVVDTAYYSLARLVIACLGDFTLRGFSHESFFIVLYYIGVTYSALTSFQVGKLCTLPERTALSSVVWHSLFHFTILLFFPP